MGSPKKPGIPSIIIYLLWKGQQSPLYSLWKDIHGLIHPYNVTPLFTIAKLVKITPVSLCHYKYIYIYTHLYNYIYLNTYMVYGTYSHIMLYLTIVTGAQKPTNITEGPALSPVYLRWSSNWCRGSLAPQGKNKWSSVAVIPCKSTSHGDIINKHPDWKGFDGFDVKLLAV